MTTSTQTTEEVIDLIEMNDDAASGAVAQLDTYCQQDEIGRTPLNTAIEFNNRDIIALITESDNAIDYFPRIEDDLIYPVKHTVTDAVNEGQVADTEKYLVGSFGSRMCFQRTPLHTACRYANQEAMSKLVSRNAEVNARDILGLTPLELAIELGGPDTATAFLDACKENERNLDISDLTLRMACANPGLYRRVVQQGSMDKKARRFAFNFSAALLDEDAMEQLLQAGMKIKDAFGPELNPIREVCTSRLLSVYEHPEASRLAEQYAAATDFGGSAIHVDNDDISNAQTLEDIQALFNNAEKKEQDKKRRQTSYTLSDVEQQALLKKRIALINLLARSGATAKMIQRKAPYGFASDIVSMGSPEILQALANIGVTLAPEEDGPSELVSALVNRNFGMIDPLIQMGHEWTGEENNHPELLREYRKWKKDNESDVVQLNLPEEKADTAEPGSTVRAVRNTDWTWELAGESMLLATTVPEKIRSGKPVIARVTHSNVYGQCDFAKLFVRIGDPKKPTAFEDLGTDDEWQSMKLVEELLSIDGEEVNRSSISEPLYGETPWEGTYECELVFKKGKHSIEIRLVSDEEGLSGVISDWVVTAA